MKKWYDRLVTLGFCLFLAVVLAGHLALADRQMSPEENRVLAQRPALSWSGLMSGEFQEDLQDYVADQFPLRDAMISLKARSERLSGKKENNGVFLGREQTLLRDYGLEGESRVQSNAQAVEQLAQQVDVPVYLTLVPTSTEIWADRLPAAAHVRDEKAWMALAGQQLSQARYLDCYDALAQAADQDIYYRTDHHWTTLGAYRAYAALAEQMGLTPLGEAEFDRQRVSENFNGTLYSRSGVRFYQPDAMERWVDEQGLELLVWEDNLWQQRPVYAQEQLAEKDQYAYFLGGNHPLAVVQNPAAESEKRLLIVRDSYADCQAPFWAQHFQQVHLADLRYYRQGLTEYIQANEIDAVLVLYGMAGFPTDTNLAFIA